MCLGIWPGQLFGAIADPCRGSCLPAAEFTGLAVRQYPLAFEQPGVKTHEATTHHHTHFDPCNQNQYISVFIVL